MKGVKDEDFAMFSDPLAWTSPVEEWLSTGILALDRLTGGGLPVGRIIELAAWESVGKAQPLTSPVLTPRGFVPMGDLVVGSAVIGVDGCPTEVEGVYPQGVAPIFRVWFSDGTATKCTADHLWTVTNYHGNARTCRLQDLRENGVRRKGGAPKWYVPLMAPAHFDEQSVPLDPYLLGLLLGDGCLASGSSIVFSNPESDLCLALAAALQPSEGVTEHSVLGVRIVGSGHTRRTLCEMGLMGKRSWEKRIPEAYCYALPEHRLSLIQGLLDTDGHVPKEGIAEFSSSSEELAQGFAFLVRSLGGVAVLSDRIPTFTDSEGDKKQGRRAYRVHARFLPGVVPVRSVKHLARWGYRETPPLKSIVAIEECGEQECQCIRVSSEDGLYVTAGFTVTHNSTILDQAMAMCQREGHVAALIDSEQARDAKYTARLGVDLDQLITHKAETIEDGFIGMDRILSIQEAHFARLAEKKKRPPIMLMVWDSIAGTPTRAERDGAADETHVMEAARKIKLNMRRMAQRISKARVIFIFANQFYETLQGRLKTYGGSGIRYFTSLRIWLSRIKNLEITRDKEKVLVGHVIEAKLRKTRVAMPRPPAQIGLLHGAGVHNAYTLFEWGKVAGVAEGHKWVQAVPGGYNYLMRPDGTHIAFRGSFVGFAGVLEEHPEIYAKMAADYRAEGFAEAA